MESSDADPTTLQEIGVNGALLEKLLAAQIYTIGQLSVWLRAAQYRPITGIGREQIARLSDLLMDHQLEQAESKKAEREKPQLVRVKTVDKDGNPTGMKTVRMDQIRTDVPRKPLTPEQRKRALDLYPRARRMCCISSEDWLAGFEHDQHPDREIDLWERLVELSDQLWIHRASKPYKREQVDEAIVAVSMNTVDVPSQTGVTDEFVALIRELYTKAAKP
jgi:hypothetical protein